MNIYRSKTLVLLVAVVLSAAVMVFGQTSQGGVKPSYFSGDVLSISDAGISIKTKDGDVSATFSDKTSFKRVPPETPNLSSAIPAERSDIGIGDKVALSALPAGPGQYLARSVYLMTKADIAQKSAKDLEQWRTRGISGKVVSTDAAAGTVTVQIAGLMGNNSSLILSPKPKAKFLRYAPDSVRFDEAKESSLAEIKVGDMLRALGDKSADGTHFDAEEVLSGAFQTIAGTVKTVDPVKKEIVIKDLRTGKDMTIVITDASIVKRFPAEMAERMAGFQGGSGARQGGGGQPGAGGGQVQGTGQGEGAGQAAAGPRGGGRGAGGRGIDDLLDRFPAITAADLKPGEMIALSSSKNGVEDRVKAIKLLAGVEPFLRMAQASGGQRGQQGGIQGGINIPGLDGISFP